MQTNGIYFGKENFYSLIRSLGGTWNDSKERPIICLVESLEHSGLYWAIPMGNWNHRDEAAQNRIEISKIQNQNFDEILEFIHRRFPVDCNWLSGNCFYFSIILKSNFKSGDIYDDVINGHFLFLYDGKYYDWSGIVIPDGVLVRWKDFKKYDPLQYDIIVRDCIQ